MKLPSPRIYYIVGFLACCAMLAIAIYLQSVRGLVPCPLCQLQRMVFAVLAFLFLCAALQNPQSFGIRTYAWVLFFVACVGGGVALRHLWLQYTPQLPPQNCGAGVNYLLHTLPLSDALRLMLQGSGECADSQWSFLSVSLPGWSFLGFLFLGFLSVWQNFRVKTE